MSLANLTSPDAVIAALNEFDKIGREQFLSKYGFRKARAYFLIRDGHAYDSKAVAGAAHGYEHSHLGPLQAEEFSGGDTTVKARLEALGFKVEVTEPREGAIRPLRLFEDYSRREVHDIFSPRSDFVSGAGLWGMSGIVEHKPNDFILFVTFGSEQAEHIFDEGVTRDGVVSWQSQPSQALNDPRIRRLITHDHDHGNVRLFLRTTKAARDGTPRPYTYLGRLAYVTHDAERERPVYFQWQIVDDWPCPTAVLERMGLSLTSPEGPSVDATESETTPPSGLIEIPPPHITQRLGRGTNEFRARRSQNRGAQDAKNRALGVRGERAVVDREQRRLREGGRPDLAADVRHVAEVDGDGAGYDVASFELDGADRYIEVKTTCGDAATTFVVSVNEVEFSKQYGGSYHLYRVCDFDSQTGAGRYYIRSGPLVDGPSLQLQPIQFRVRVLSGPKE